MNDNTTTIRELCEAYGISQTELSRAYGIPLRTVQDWHAGRRTPPSYVINMLLELLLREHNEHSEDGIYLIFTDSQDDGATIVGYCLNEAEADKYCEDHQSDYWNELSWQRLKKL